VLTTWCVRLAVADSFTLQLLLWKHASTTRRSGCHSAVTTGGATRARPKRPERRPTTTEFALKPMPRLSRTTSTRYGAAPASERLLRVTALPQVFDPWRESARMTSNVVRNSVNWRV
jgi:hypothetical protein